MCVCVCLRVCVGERENALHPGGGGGGVLEDGNVVVDFGTVPLGDALGDPDDVPTLLLLQLHVGVEDAEVELVEEGQLVQLHLRVRRERSL